MRLKGILALVALISIAVGAAAVLSGCKADDQERARAELERERAAAHQELAEVLDLEPDVHHGLEVYRSCAQCHQPEGWGSADGSYPQLAGQHRSVIIKQMADIRACLRDNFEMFPFASADEIGGAQSVADVAGYIDTLEISTHTGKGPGDALDRGRELYDASCASCHGAKAEGSDEEYVPRLQAQHYVYLVREFQAIRDGRRGNAHQDMLQRLGSMSDADVDAILDYVSRIEPPPELQAPPGWRNPDFPKPSSEPSDT